MAVTKEFEKHTITIDIRNGEIVYDKPKVITGPGDVIGWKCEVKNAHFAVHFDPISPLALNRASALGEESINDEILLEASSGRYKYFVAVFDGKRIYTDDPELIVRRRR